MFSRVVWAAVALLAINSASVAWGQGTDVESFRPGLRFGGRLHGGLQVVDGDPYHRFWIERARLALDLEPTDWARAEIDLDVAELEIEDASVRLRMARWLRVKFGRFKKPFSRIELTGPGKLPLWRRGIVNDVIVEEFGFGDRDLGVTARGRWRGLGYAVGVFNGNNRGLTDTNSGKDISARFTYRAFDGLRLGVSTGFKYVNRGCVVVDGAETHDTRRSALWAAGVDAKLVWGPVDWVVEVLWGMRANGPRALGGTTFATVRVPIAEGVELRPIVKAELLRIGLRGDDNLAWSFVAGANLHLGDCVRLMLQAEGVWTQANVRTQDIVEERLVLLNLAFDYARWQRLEEP